MKVGTLVRYELNDARPLGVITGLEEFEDPKTGRKYKTYRVQWNKKDRLATTHFKSELVVVSLTKKSKKDLNIL